MRMIFGLAGLAALAAHSAAGAAAWGVDAWKFSAELAGAKDDLPEGVVVRVDGDTGQVTMQEKEDAA